MLNKRLALIFLAILLILLSIVCLYFYTNQAKQTKTLFTLMPPSETGIDFENKLPVDVMGVNNVLSSQYYYNGGGVALGDINNDGLIDIYFTANRAINKLYLNMGKMKFKDITEDAGVGSKRFSTGAVFVDINNDDFLDLYVCNSGVIDNPRKLANQLYINQKDGTFKEMGGQYNVNDPNHSTQAAFFDYDADGDLDLYVMNHSILFQMSQDNVKKEIKNKKKLRKLSGRLLENNNGTFIDVTQKSGLLRHGYGLGLSVSDINSDGYPDIYVANDFSIPDFFYINNGDGTFTDKQKELTRQISWFGMGTDIADINNDGFLDIGVLDMAANDHVRSKTFMASMNPSTVDYYVNVMKYPHQFMFNTLQLNNGNNTFSNIANLAGISKTDWSWGALFADFNNDGFKDFFVSNGFRKNTLDNDFQIKLKETMRLFKGKIDKKNRQELYKEMPEVKLPNKLFINNQNLKFNDIGDEQGLHQPSFSNGAAYADLDNDGDLDLVVNNIDQEAFIYKNNSQENNNNYLRVSLYATNNSEYYNAKVFIYYDKKVQMQEYSPVRGFQSCVEHTLHFGIPENVNKVDSILVYWLDGTSKKVENPKLNSVVKITKLGSEMIAKKRLIETLFETVEASNYDITFIHKENQFDDFIDESLLPHKQSVLGPFSSVADVNKDGLDDIYIGGAKGQPGALYRQQTSGKFIESCSDVWGKDKSYEDMGSLFFDYDNDGDKDLYVVSGGGGDVKSEPSLLQDRIYINNGNGEFIKAMNVLPKIESSGQQVKANDIDMDGDLDLFVGGRTMPGKYPYSPKSYILINENGKYIDKSNDWLGEDLSFIGMVTDFVFTDLNNDQLSDLVIVGEWMSVTALLNKGNSFTDVSSEYGFDKLKGWWYSIEQADFNNDGKIDFLLGNIGKNIKFKASMKKPFHIYTNDFDETGDQDIVLSYYYKGEQVPSRGRECSSGEMPFITSQCKTYQDFAEASIEDIYGKDKIEDALHFEATTFESYILLSDSNASYIPTPLNIEAQFSPINRFIVKDFDNDGNKDIILAGNMYHTEVETPRYDAGPGLYLQGLGNGYFNSFPVYKSGIYLPYDVKDLDFITLNGKEGVLVSNNNREPQLIIKR